MSPLFLQTTHSLQCIMKPTNISNNVGTNTTRYLAILCQANQFIIRYIGKAMCRIGVSVLELLHFSIIRDLLVLRHLEDIESTFKDCEPTGSKIMAKFLI